MVAELRELHPHQWITGGELVVADGQVVNRHRKKALEAWVY
jgi:hypothetical protein